MWTRILHAVLSDVRNRKVLCTCTLHCTGGEMKGNKVLGEQWDTLCVGFCSFH